MKFVKFDSAGKRIFLALVGVAGFAFAAAGIAMAEPVQVQILNGMLFSPNVLTVNEGDTVEFVNVSNGSHTVTADPSLVRIPASISLPAGAQAFNSGSIAPGARWSHTFTTPGAYKYTCLPHERMGMQGNVIVKALPPRLTVNCTAKYSNGSLDVGEPKSFSGSVAGDQSSAPISEDFVVEGITARLHVFFDPQNHFVSINYSHSPTDTVLNTDSFVQANQPISIYSRTNDIGPGIDGIQVTCLFQ